MKAQIEVTDTFAGEANYCWVRRHEIEADCLTRLQIVRRLKALAELNGVRCVCVAECGNYFQYKVIGACITFFITFDW